MTSAATYALLALAIAAEVVGTSALKASEGFTRPGPSALTVAGYGLAFYLLAHVLKTVPVGVAYAIWSGGGIVLIAAIGFVWFRQTLDLPALIGVGMIVAGVLVVSLLSRSIAH